MALRDSDRPPKRNPYRRIDRTILAGTPPKSVWPVSVTLVFLSARMFLLFLPSGVHRSESDLAKPLRPRGLLLLREKLPPAPVIASKPLDLNIPDLGGLVCPTSIRTASTSSLPDMQSRIQAGNGQARNPTATLGFSW